ncbi:formimidoylglutamate deiminase [Nocardioides marmoribigeumensis]|uniref:Formiminoglutamate deiminase n=1 Tax=Nocardioides marmoribigeumensis TaxID=433649 RepID=A0ABU2BVF1_9ACTN|nr:formimidoylglutamate deiminase [Nocardioides marmoribigeumensis]MDR7362615.1 formiminoglutamate deiminase [Nocardioides marmoribigeumensis]
MTTVTTYLLEHAWLPDGISDDVYATVVDGRFSKVGHDPVRGAHRLAGLTIPGLANCHSHAFHRALRGRTQRGDGTFWTWREQMYAVAQRLDPDAYRELAVAVFGEMALAGITTVGEFHYLHHGPDGTPYDDPNAMGNALLDAAREVGIRITLLDTCYLTAGIGRPPEGVQVRYSDGSGRDWQDRVDEQTAEEGGDVVVGAAIHSVRAVPLEEMRLVADWADRFEVPLHVHLSEQVAENDECLAAYGRTPTEVLAEAGALGDRTSAVHATHLTDSDVALLGSTRTVACFCPTTERDLGDGVGPSTRLRDAGSPLTLGSDSHAVVDLFEEMRAVELDERLVSRSRGHWRAPDLLRAATYAGHASLGFRDAGRIEPGARADLVSLDLASPRTAGCGPTAETVAYAVSAADVTGVVAGGRVLLEQGERGDAEQRVGAALAAAVEGLLR